MSTNFMATEQAIIPKYPFRLRIDSGLVFLSFHLLFWFLYYFCGIYPAGQIAKLLFSVPYAILLSSTIIICIIGNEIFIRKIYQYDGTIESIKSTNRTVGVFVLMQMVCTIGCGMCLPMCIKKACEINGFYYIPHDPLFCTLGSICLAATLCFIFWLEHFDAWLKWLPFKKEDILFSNIVRRILVVLFATVGIVFVTLAANRTMEVRTQEFPDLSIWDVYKTKIIPVSAVGLLYAFLDVMFESFSELRHLNQVVTVIGSVSENDYSVKPLDITLRNEYGLLFNSINSFIATTKNLLINLKNTAENAQMLTGKMNNDSNSAATAMSQIFTSLSNVKQDR